MIELQQVRMPRLGGPVIVKRVYVNSLEEATEARAMLREEIRNGGDVASSDWVRFGS